VQTRPMVRKQIYLTRVEIVEINKLASSSQISVSEYIRRIIDEHIKKIKEST